MIHLIVGEYTLQPNDLVVNEISSATLNKNILTKNKNLVIYTDELNLKKKDVDALIKAEYDLTIVVHDRKIVKGKRKETKQYKMTNLMQEDFTNVNPFELVKYVFSCKDRDMLFKYLKDSQKSLYVLLMIFACNYFKLNANNRSVIEWLFINYYRVKYEIVCAKIAFAMKCEQVWRFDWFYPRKENKEEEDE